MLVDGFLPRWDVETKHHIVIYAPAERVYAHVASLDLGRSWGVRLLFRLRGLPQDALSMRACNAAASSCWQTSRPVNWSWD